MGEWLLAQAWAWFWTPWALNIDTLQQLDPGFGPPSGKRFDIPSTIIRQDT
jgi:hypothetical protein